MLELKRGYRTTEFLAACCGLFLVGMVASRLTPWEVVGGWCLIINTYITCRVLFKNHRGLFDRGHTTTEFLMMMVGLGGLSGLAFCYPLRPVFWGVLSVLSTYMLSRGAVKRIGVTTQVLFH